MERDWRLTAEEMTRYPLTVEDRSQAIGAELDGSTSLGMAILGERWLNFDLEGQQYWLARLRTGVINCNTYISRIRNQIELEIELEPGEFAYFCITLSRMNRFI